METQVAGGIGRPEAAERIRSDRHRIGSEGHGSGGGPREPARPLFLGNHKVFHNRDAARFLVREILPLVRAQVPDATLDIVGKDAESLGGWTRADGVRVLGYVPHLEDALARAAVFVAPHRFAAGVQTKVVQALAAGTPVVTTPLEREGLTPIPADLLRVGETAPEIAAQVLDLIRNPAAAAELGARGREWARARFQWEFSVRAFEAAAARVAMRHELRDAPVIA